MGLSQPEEEKKSGRRNPPWHTFSTDWIEEGEEEEEGEKGKPKGILDVVKSLNPVSDYRSLLSKQTLGSSFLAILSTCFCVRREGSLVSISSESTEARKSSGNLGGEELKAASDGDAVGEVYPH